MKLISPKQSQPPVALRVKDGGRKASLFFHILIANSLPPLCQGEIHARGENRFVARKRQRPGSLQEGTDRMENARATVAAASLCKATGSSQVRKIVFH
jgi:hypothetical protein